MRPARGGHGPPLFSATVRMGRGMGPVAALFQHATAPVVPASILGRKRVENESRGTPTRLGILSRNSHLRLVLVVSA
jgi:hypothetical protein